MLRWLGILVLVGLLTPMAEANSGESAIQGMTLDLFMDLPLEDLSLETRCGENPSEANSEFRLDAAADRLIFSEGSFANVQPSQVGGAARAVCGRASVQLEAPGILDHVHVRYWADRTIEQIASMVPHARQQFTLRPDVGASTTIDYFANDAVTRPEARFATNGAGNVTYFPVSPQTQSVGLEWIFEDMGLRAIESIPSPVSGQQFEASIRDPWVEFSLAQQPVTRVEEHHEQEGSRRFERYVAVVDYNETNWGIYHTNVRVIAHDSLAFSHIEAPDGARISATGVLPHDAEYSHDVPYVLLETNSQAGQVHVTMPSTIARAHGPGEFRFVFENTMILKPEPGLVAFNGLVAAIPLAFAGVAYVRVEQFRREAFGAYKRTARNLLVTLLFVVAYYIAVLGGAIIAGWFRLLSVLPLGTEAVLLYIQVALAILAFLWLWATAREMYAITKP